MKKLLVGALFFVASCGALVDPIHHDSRFDAIKEQFEKDALAFGVQVDTADISISFGDTRKRLKYAGVIPLTKDPGPSYGYCLVLGKTNNDLERPLSKLALGSRHNSKIVIISNELKSFPISELEATVYHELGHCALNLGHNENEMLMSSSFKGGLESFRYFILKELFTRKKAMPRALLKAKYMDPNAGLLYEADYEAFDQRIFYRIYYSSLQDRHYFVDNRIY